MILINDVKYSCMECIRGHRSSTCKHHDRPLLQVRSKGRPGVYANGNPNHRVAVFAEEIATPTDDTDSEDKGTTSTPPLTPRSCKSQPIVILKASSKQVIDLTNGEIIGPYDESKTTKSTVEKAPPQQPIINDESFIISSGCCAPKVSKRSGCGCCGNKKKDVNKSKILQTYIEKRLNKDVVIPPKQVKFISESPHQNQMTMESTVMEHPYLRLFQYHLVPYLVHVVVEVTVSALDAWFMAMPPKLLQTRHYSHLSLAEYL